MPRQTLDQPITTRAARERLAPRRRPYFRNIDAGVALGYRRGSSGGTWLVRAMVDGSYQEMSIGRADDAIKADGTTYLDFRQAEAKARAEVSNLHHRAAGLDAPDTARSPYTVGDAMGAYLRSYSRRGGKWVRHVENNINAHILPNLGVTRLDRLTRSRVVNWRDSLIEAAPRLRTRAGATPGPRRLEIDVGDPDAMRRRRATANRLLAILSACCRIRFRNAIRLAQAAVCN